MTKIYGIIIPLVLLASCMVQLSSVPKIRDLNISEQNTAMIAVFAEYRMNMSSSKDVKFYLQEITTGIIIAPHYSDACITIYTSMFHQEYTEFR